MAKRPSRRARHATAQSAHVAERASAATDRASASIRMFRARHLSEGVAVEASVIARLLGWRLLTIDASVLLLPAAVPPIYDVTAAPPPNTWNRNAAKRERLSDAIKTIDQAEHDLAEARDSRGRFPSSAFG